MDFKDLKVRSSFLSFKRVDSFLSLSSRSSLSVFPNTIGHVLISFLCFADVQSLSARTLFDAHESSTTPKQVAPEDEQEPNESRRLWHDLTEAIKTKDMEAATQA